MMRGSVLMTGDAEMAIVVPGDEAVGVDGTLEGKNERLEYALKNC